MSTTPDAPTPSGPTLVGGGTWIDAVIRFCLTHKLVAGLLAAFVIAWGVIVAPFDWDIPAVQRSPVAVDAIPDIGENQQIVFAEWMGRSPQDVEDQVTYPLSTALLGVPAVKTIRSFSMFGFSSIYIIFREDAEFYWTRSRVLEKLNSLPAGTLPEDVKPMLGPDATALGQVYWYTLEGRDPDGKPIGGWDLHELRSVQDWQVRYALQSAEGISEAASVGGFVREYQIDVDPDALRHYGVTLEEVFAAARASNVDTGARTIEVNRVDYVIRGLGFIRQLSDIEQAVVKVRDNTPVLVRNVARVSLGPAYRRGALDRDGAEAVGGVAIVRYGFNPLEAIKNLKKKIAEIAPSLPARPVLTDKAVPPSEIEAFGAINGFSAWKNGALDEAAWLRWLRANPRDRWPSWITLSQVTVVPFYDRTGLIYETLGTLNDAIIGQILITVIVVLLSIMHFRSSILISAVMPFAVLIAFIGMKTFHVDANLVSLSGIAIAIGTLVDMGIILCENILNRLDEAPPGQSRAETIFQAASELGGALLTAISTTIVGFLPVFTMTGAEGKLFKPLAYTKTFALFASIVVALTLIPPAACILFGPGFGRKGRNFLRVLIILAAAPAWLYAGWWAGVSLLAVGLGWLAGAAAPARLRKAGPRALSLLAVVVVTGLLTAFWLPLGAQRSFGLNLLFVAGAIAGLMTLFFVIQGFYTPALRWCLAHKTLTLLVPAAVVLFGASAWLGFGQVFGFAPWLADKLGLGADTLRQKTFWVRATHALPGLGKEFMPPLDEGSFLYMPTTMPHASIGEALDILQKQDKALRAIPEIETVAGKIGRAETPLDPAPISMIETVISYRPEYVVDKDGRRLRFRFDEGAGQFPRDARGQLIPDSSGKPFRQWRPHIRSADDIWREIVKAAEIPGATSAPKLQPIAARIVMLQSGLRAPMGVKVFGPTLDAVEKAGYDIERLLKQAPNVEPATVIADRISGVPYLEIHILRDRIARYGLTVRQVQDVIETAIGGQQVATTVEGRERYPVRVRYLRELRDRADALGRILVASMDGAQIPLAQLAEITYVRGPEAIKSEDTRLVGYVLFDKVPGAAEVDVVEGCQRFLAAKAAAGELQLPPGVSYAFSGSYENQIRSQKTLALILPLSLFIIFLILYFQFKDVPVTLLVFSGVFIAGAGGFTLLWLYGQPWFLDLTVLGVNLRDLFQVHTVNLSVAIWVGFLALFGVATDDGVVMATYIRQSLDRLRPASIAELRQAVAVAAQRRIRPCLMTSSTTILALLPVLTSTGRGADIMIPMALPSFGGLLIVLVSEFTVPALYCALEEHRLRRAPIPSGRP